jgi:hypothetical protein
MLTQRWLLTIAAVIESLTGSALILAPGATISLALGVKPNHAGHMIGRGGGMGLLALGISCWGARMDQGGAARAGTLRAITLYNAGAGLLLALFAATGHARGRLVWSASVLHLGLAAGFAAQLRPNNGGSRD